MKIVIEDTCRGCDERFPQEKLVGGMTPHGFIDHLYCKECYSYYIKE